MPNRIPILTPNDAASFLKYFSGVDQVLSRRFSLGFQSDEEHLTSLLCELLDSRGAELHNLTYSISALNTDLERSGSILRAALTIKTNAYNKYQERYFTQSDIGLIVDYNDRIERAASFKKGILLQAKRLFPLKEDNYGLRSKYESFDERQHSRLEALVKSMAPIEKNKEKELRGETDCARYLLYNPPFSSLDNLEKEWLIRCQLEREASAIFDYTAGLHVYKDLLDTGGVSTFLTTGCLCVTLRKIHSIASKPGNGAPAKLSVFTLEEVLRDTDVRRNSLPWFIVFDLLLGNGGCTSKEIINFITGAASAISNEYQIAPPRYVFTVTITVGSPRG